MPRNPFARIVVLGAVAGHAEQCAVVRDNCWKGVRTWRNRIPLAIRLQTHRKFVEVLGDLMVAVQALVEVGLPVPIQVVQDRELVAAENVNFFVHDLQAERLEQAARNPLPTQPRLLPPAPLEHCWARRQMSGWYPRPLISRPFSREGRREINEQYARRLVVPPTRHPHPKNRRQSGRRAESPAQ